MPLFGPPNIEKMKAKRDVNGLIKTLGYQKDNSVQTTAAYELGKLGDPRAVEPLIAALENSKTFLPATAANALGKLGDPRAVEPLIAALKSSDSFLQENAADALGKLGDPRAVRPLIAAHNDASSNFTLRGSAMRALKKIGTTTIEPLIVALTDSDKNVRICAADALGEIGDPHAVEPLMAVFKDSDESVRTGAVRALSKIGDARAVEPLIAALEDKRVNEVAAKALLPFVDARAAKNSLTMAQDGQTGQVAVDLFRKILERDADNIPMDDLQTIALLGEVIQFRLVENIDCPSEKYLNRLPVDLSQVRQLARIPN
ncbi:MAG: HEAT repeat domain-containing protein [Chloroflexi bacterium]|nr:HEAT repeat domain-containing protein [Chloroflexota bacterium]